MSKIEARWADLRHLDDLAAGSSPIHRLHPGAKLLATFVFLLVVTSFPKYEVAGLIPLAAYPIILLSLGNLPLRPVAQRLLFAMPFIVLIGIFNPLFDRAPALELGPVIISGGWLSLASIILRSTLAIAAALLLLATTGIDAIGMALGQLKVPRSLIMQLLFLHRYLYVLLDEFTRTVRAYSFRSLKEGEGIRYRVWGSLLGQLLLRTVDRARRIYQAMLCRGFAGEIRLLRRERFRAKDAAYLLVWSAFFLFARLVNIPKLLGTLLLLLGGR